MGSERAGVQRSSFPWAQVLYAMLFIGLVGLGLYLGYVAYASIRTLASQTQLKPVPILPAPRSQQPQQGSVEQPHRQQPSAGPQAPPKSEIYPDVENKERINILFLGIDQRPTETAACRTDTMILVSVNPKDISASLLSIPRDLWVPIPGRSEGKINTAHYWGEVDEYPGGGPTLAKHTVRYNFGVPVHYYVRLNFAGFVQIVDTLGGIDVDVPVAIDDYEYPDNNYGTEYLHVDAGPQHFDGDMALKYARTRKGTGDGDFTRMQRQQQVIFAVRDKVLSLPNLPQLIPQLPQLARSLGDSLETDIPPDVMLKLALMAQQVKRERIRTETIDRRMTEDSLAGDGQAILIYDREKARPIIEALFSDPTPEAPTTQDSQVGKLEAEQAQVAVYNGTTTPGLAERIADFFKMQGIQVIEFGNADHSGYEHTVVSVYGEKPFTVHWLESWLAGMGIAEPDVRLQAVQSKVDIAVIIGVDFPVDKIK